MPLQDPETLLADETCIAMDDPVPGDSESCLYGSGVFHPHKIEENVQRALLSLPNLEFSSLQVHRLADGICLTGVVKVPATGRPPQLERLAAKAAGVQKVLNHLVVQMK